MALTSKKDVKSDCLPLSSSKLKYHIPHTCIDQYLMKRRLSVIISFKQAQMLATGSNSTQYSQRKDKK